MKKLFLLLVLYLSAIGVFAQGITGPNAVCVGSTITVSDASPGGAWVSSNTAVGTIGSSTGIVGGISTGLTTITYNFLGGGFVTYGVTVYATPAPITGPSTVCVGSTIPLGDVTAGNTWSSSNSSCASVSATGVVTGVTAPCTATITYGNPGCYVTHAVTVLVTPAAMTGTMSICGAGNTTTISDPSPGGTFSGGTPCVSVGAGTGVCTGITAPCTGTITYTLSDGCFTTATVTVFAIPTVTTTGNQALCSGATTTTAVFTGSIPGTTFSWTNSNPSIGLAASGTGSSIAPFTAINTGTSPVVATITVTPIANGCPGTPVSFTITVNPLPPLCTVTGGGVCCAGTTGAHVGLSCSTPGINYQLYCGSVAIGAPVAGTGSAIDFGPFCTACVFTVVGTNAVTGCSSTMTGSATVTVAPLPVLSSSLAAGSICSGLMFSYSPASSTLGTTFSWTRAAVAGISNPAGSGVGNVNEVLTNTTTSPITVTYVYTLNGGGCTNTQNVTVTVNPTPGPITGTLNICVGQSYSLSCPPSGGSFSCTPPNASITTGGSITGILPGTTVVTYTLPTGCSTSVTVTVHANPVVFTVSGGGAYCDTGSCPHIYLSGSEVGVGYAVYCSGVQVGPTMPGTGFPIDLGPRCTSCVFNVVGETYGTNCLVFMSGTATVTYNPPPAPISGTTTIVCPATSTTLSDATSGGSWSSSNPLCGSVSTTGVVTSVNPGPGPCTTVIKYQTSPGCFVTVTVNIPYCGPIPGGRDTTSCCVDSLTINTGYDPVTDAAIAFGADCSTPVHDPKWIVTYESPDIATSLLTTPICTGAIEVTPVTNADVIGIGFPSCWFTNPKSGWISCVNNKLGYATVSTGVYHMILTRPFTMCRAGLVTINLQLAYDNYITSTNIDGAGSFYSSGVINNCSTGAFHPASTTIYLSAGVHSINVDVWNYAVNFTNNTTGLNVVGVIKSADDSGSFVNESRSTPCCCYGCEVTGNSHICVGGTTHLSSCAGGCTWTSSNAVATVNACTGVVTGVTGGVAIISHVSDIGCITTMTVTVDALPTAYTVGGGGTYCTGGPCPTACPHVILSGSQVGVNYQLYCGSTLVPPALAGTGAALDFGPQCGPCTYTVKATNGIGCTNYMTGSVTSTPLAPCPITGPTSVCAGSTITLTTSCTPTSCPWSSGDPAVATVSCTGVVTGVAGGVVTITYTSASGCISTHTVTVNAVCPISGGLSFCFGSTTTLTTCCTGGVWSSSNPACIVVNPTSGVCTGVSAPCCSSITYTAMGGCTSSVTVCVYPVPTVNPNPVVLCVGNSTTLIPNPTGGSWTGTPCLTLTPSGTNEIATGMLAPCVDYITYSKNGCSVNVPVTVNPVCPITGPTVNPHKVCVGATVSLTTSCAGGTWSSSNSCVTVGSTGVVTGVSAPCSATITYTSAGGCISTYTMTVVPGPTVWRMGYYPLRFCQGIGTLLYSSEPSTWCESSTAYALLSAPCPTVTSTEGISGMMGGTQAIVVTSTITGCSTTITVTVDPSPTIVGTIHNLCENGTLGLSLSQSTPGNWSSSNTYFATVSGSGFVTAHHAGVVTITFCPTNGCMCHTYTITINPTPVITGASTVCLGSSIAQWISPSMSGSWFNYSLGGNVNLSSYISPSISVSGMTPGWVELKFTSSLGCPAVPKYIQVIGHPNAGTLSVSPNPFCYGPTGATITNVGGATGGTYTAYGPASTLISGTNVTASGFWFFPVTELLTYNVYNGCFWASSSTTFVINPCHNKEGRGDGGNDGTVVTAPELQVFPNPNQGMFTVNLLSDKDESAEVRVTNIIGETVTKLTTVTNKENTLQVTGAAGMYLVTVTTPRGSYVAKVVIE